MAPELPINCDIPGGFQAYGPLYPNTDQVLRLGPGLQCVIYPGSRIKLGSSSVTLDMNVLYI
jgi:hypothetical protein